MNALREKLNAVISKYHDSVAAADNAKETLSRAQAFVSGLEAQASAFGAVDKKIAASRAASIEKAISAGEAPTIEISPELAAELAKKLDAENHLTAARQAVSVLQEKCDAFNQAAARSDLEREWAAAEVLSSESTGMAEAFAADFKDLRRRYFVLQAMTTQRVPIDPTTLPANLPSSLISPTTHIDFSDEVSKVVQLGAVIGSYEVNSREQQIRNESARAVEDFFDRLKNDASATIEDSLL
jgi:hypothetical protein